MSRSLTMKPKILEGTTLYQSGECLGSFDLAEGEVSGRLIIIESMEASFVDMKEVKPTDGELRLFEAAGAGSPLAILEGRFQMADTRNKNRRIYPDALWTRLLAENNPASVRARNGEMLGECDHPRDGETLLSRVCCMTTKYWRNPKRYLEILGRMVIFNNSKGQDLMRIREGGGRFGVSSRGSGSLVRKDGVDIVQDDFELECWDVVHNPSTPGAYPATVSESKTISIPTGKEFESMALLPAFKEKFDRLSSYLNEKADDGTRDLVNKELAVLESDISKARFDSDEVVGAAMLGQQVTQFRAKLATINKESAPAKQPVTESAKSTAISMRPVSKDEITAYLSQNPISITETGMREALEQIRTGYRTNFKIEGPLTPIESEALREHTQKLVERRVSPNRVGVKLTETGGTTQEFSVLSEQELVAQLTERLNGRNHIVVEVDRSAKIDADAAQRYNALLERQVIKTTDALREAAKAKGAVSDLSAKVACAVQVIEGMKDRLLAAEKAKQVAEQRYAAAVKLLEALSDEVEFERLKGCVEALAATNPQMPHLEESLSSVTTVSEAVRIVRTARESDETPRKFQRAALPTKEGIQRALNISEAVQKTSGRKRKPQSFNPQSPTEAISEELTDRVLEALEGGQPNKELKS